MEQFSGKVIHDDNYGNKLGFPTVNIDRKDYLAQRLSLKYGIYAGLVKFGSKTYVAGIVVGPVDKNNLPKLEAHLLDFQGDLYGKRLTFLPQRFLRPFKIYSKENALRKQIQRDIINIRKLNLHE